MRRGDKENREGRESFLAPATSPRRCGNTDSHIATTTGFFLLNAMRRSAYGAESGNALSRFACRTWDTLETSSGIPAAALSRQALLAYCQPPISRLAFGQIADDGKLEQAGRR